MPLRRRKRIKRKASNSSRNKWHRPDIADNTENRPVEQQSVTVNEHGEVLSMTEVHPRKTVQGASQTEGNYSFICHKTWLLLFIFL